MSVPSAGRLVALALSVGLAFAGASLPGQQPGRSAPGPNRQAIRKPTLDDTIKATIYADNWFSLYVNGELVAVDSISFLPHNVVEVDLLPSYPMTIAVMARDNADPETGMEYANTNIGDGGFILKLGDGTVTDARWKAKAFSRGPIGGDTQKPRVEDEPIPADWFEPSFDDSAWPQASEYTEQEVGPKETFYDHDFRGAHFIWSDDLALDNTVLFRLRVEEPPDGRARPDFSDLNDQIPGPAPRRTRR
ncbi:MAG: hypothetical protein SFV24_24145 [Gemmatimonadales bacterium]|nr:hypothetical protein [Gemmatimonadales bacterium]